MNKVKKTAMKFGIAALVGLCVALFLWLDAVRLLEQLENASYDLRYHFKYQGELNNNADTPYPDYGIHIVDIDERSMAKLGLYWNWNRGFQATMVDSLSSRFSAAVAFDVLFFAPEDNNQRARFDKVIDNTLKNVIESSLKAAQLKEQLLSSIDYDIQFQNAIERSGRVFMGLSLAEESDYRGMVSQISHRMSMDWHNSLNPASALTLPDSLISQIKNTKTIIDGIYPENARAAREIGHVNAIAVDEVIREIPLFYRFSNFEPIYLPLSIRTAATLFGTPNDEIIFKPHEYLDVGKPFKIFKDSEGTISFSYPDFTEAQLKIIIEEREKLLSLKNGEKADVSSYTALFRDNSGKAGLEMRTCRIPHEGALALISNAAQIADMDIDDEKELDGGFSIVRDSDSEWELISGSESFWLSGTDVKTLSALTADDLRLEPFEQRKLLFFEFWIKRDKGILVSPLPVLRAASLNELLENSMDDIEAIAAGERRDFGKAVKIPLRAGNRHIITYFGPSSKPFPYFSFCDVMDNNIKYPLEGRIFIVGSTSPAMFDIKPAPHQKDFPAVEIHASVMNSIFTDTFIRRFTARQDFLLLVLVAIATSLMALFSKPLWGSLCAAGTLVMYCIAAFQLFDSQLLWIEIVRPVLAIIISFSTVMAYRYMTEEKDRKFLQSTFKQYLSPALIDIMYTQKQKPQLGGEEGVRTAFFTDIEGFSTFSEKLTPTKLVDLLNEYLSAMTDILLSRYGTLDKYIGDAIVAFWGAPVSIKEHALQACHAAIDMQHELENLRQKWRSEGDKWPQIVHNMRMRIGVNTGSITTGNMGSAVRMNYTMMGDAVNLTARLESAAKNYGVYTIISQYTYEMVKDSFEVRMLDKITVVGKSEPVVIYELLCKKGELTSEMNALLEVYNRGVKNYYSKDFQSAQICFTQALEIEPGREYKKTTPSARFENMCKNFIENPPPESWDGVNRLTSK
ncbi:MAG: CHASE2 domain-containing protein [Chitinispirillales bacterium]|jgi:adenylate cyclase|nr:CHASE2 domain-containing protein [Chitinispirillales bacterium]